MKNFDSIEEALNVDTEVVEDNKIEPRKNQLKKDDKNDSEKDYEYSRANLYSLVETVSYTHLTLPTSDLV